jgi:thiamine transport system permease protein
MKWLLTVPFVAVLSLTVMAFVGLFNFDEAGFDWSVLDDTYFHQIVIFSLGQGLLSALVSVLLAWPIARSLYFIKNLPLKKTFLSLCILCFVMPTLVLITGLVALLGRSGWLSPYISQWIFTDWNLYGLSGILLAHVYLNMPLAVRVFYIQLQGIADSSWKLSRQLKLTRWQRLRWIEWPVLKPSIIMLFGFVFILCFNSFAVVLALGGGPQSTTLEVAIYQSLKYDFNIAEALIFAWAQLLIAGAFFILVARLGSPVWLSVDSNDSYWTPAMKGWRKTLLVCIYSAAFAFLLLPVLAIFPGIMELSWQKLNLQMYLKPAVITVTLGCIAAGVGVLFAYFLLLPIRHAHVRKQSKKQVLLEWLATHALLAPTMVVSVGLFVLLLPLVSLDDWGIVMVVVLNSAIVVPFAVQKLKPRLLQFDAQYGALIRSLKLRKIDIWRIEWPFIRPVCLSTFALILVLAMGDVAIFSIFGNSDWKTLPWLIYEFAGSYRLAEASLASLILLCLCAACLWLVEWRSFQFAASSGHRMRSEPAQIHEVCIKNA